MPITRSIGSPLLSLRSISRHAAACARISPFGYHLNGMLTSSASKAVALELADERSDVIFGAAPARTEPALRRR